jgi:hypothetical protein
VINIIGSKIRAEILNIENIHYNTVAGYYSSGQSSFPENICSKKTLQSFTRNQYEKFGFYLGTIFDMEKRKVIDDFIVLLKENESLLQLENATKIFNTMVEDDVNYIKIKEIDPNCSVDMGRNQLKVQSCTNDALKEKAKEVGTLFRDQVCEELNIVGDKKTDIVLSILETVASQGFFFSSLFILCINLCINVLGDANVLPQLIHTDVDPDNPFFGEPHMWIGILGLEDSNFLRVLKYSHTKSKPEVSKSNKKKKQLKERTDTKSISVVKYEKYQYIVQHPQLSHGGYNSLSTKGLRLHGFHGFPESAQDTTYVVNFKLFTSKDHFNEIS